MSAPRHTRPTLRKGLAAGLTASMAAAGAIATFPTAAQAATGPVDYTCTTPLGPQTLTVDTDTDAGARLFAGDSATMTSKTALPGGLAQTAAAFLNAESFSGTVNLTVTEGAGPRTVALAIPETPMGDQTAPTDVPFTASGAYAPTTPSSFDLKGGDFTADLVFTKTDGTKQPFSVPCTQVTGPAATIDPMVVVARSTTTLSLDKGDARHGEKVTATAKVTTTGGEPDGEVAFTVNGVATKVKVAKDGIATFELPTLAVGAHSVTASFVPKDATHYEGSTTAPSALKVRKAKTNPRVSVKGKRTNRKTRVVVKIRTQYDTTATGKVRVVVRKIGTKRKWVRTRFLKEGQRTVGFGKLKQGRYKVRVRYSGDDNHFRGPKNVRKFRVKRG